MALGNAVQVFLLVTVSGAAIEFHVICGIDIEAQGPKEAAHAARAIQLNSGMAATVFDVWVRGGQDAPG